MWLDSGRDTPCLGLRGRILWFRQLHVLMGLFVAI